MKRIGLMCPRPPPPPLPPRIQTPPEGRQRLPRVRMYFRGRSSSLSRCSWYLNPLLAGPGFSFREEFILVSSHNEYINAKERERAVTLTAPYSPLIFLTGFCSVIGTLHVGHCLFLSSQTSRQVEQNTW